MMHCGEKHQCNSSLESLCLLVGATGKRMSASLTLRSVVSAWEAL